jgi:hypothetical protein
MKTVAKKKVVANARKTFRVYIAQVNQSMVVVSAVSRDEAIRKGYAKWRRECSHSSVLSVEQE